MSFYTTHLICIYIHSYYFNFRFLLLFSLKRVYMRIIYKTAVEIIFILQLKYDEKICFELIFLSLDKI